MSAGYIVVVMPPSMEKSAQCTLAARSLDGNTRVRVAAEPHRDAAGRGAAG
uniref:hypothetical protein n=1 Tax=Saccharothrix mutabilis TaxID=33921 RepID=UPI0031D954BC